MKILILHLSDIHFNDGNNYVKTNINGIVSALNSSVKEVQHIIL